MKHARLKSASSPPSAKPLALGPRAMAAPNAASEASVAAAMATRARERLEREDKLVIAHALLFKKIEEHAEPGVHAFLAVGVARFFGQQIFV